MNSRIPSETHSFSNGPRKLVLNGIELFHSQCRACGRDFVRMARSHHWNAAYILVFSVEFLPPEVNDRWLGEPCPGEELASDDVDRLMLRKNIAGNR